MSQTWPEDLAQLKKIARITGLFYLIIIVCGMFAEGAVRAELIVLGNPESTSQNIHNNQGLFRAGILADLVMVVADVVVALGFFVLLRAVSASLSLLAAFFRLVQASALGLNLIFLWMALQVTIGADLTPTLPGQEASVGTATPAANTSYLLLNAHATGYKLALIFFAGSLIVQSYLIYRSELFPSWLAILILLAAFGYITDTVGTLGMSNYAEHSDIFEGIVVVAALAGEITLCLWLLIKGVRSRHLAA